MLSTVISRYRPLGTENRAGAQGVVTVAGPISDKRIEPADEFLELGGQHDNAGGTGSLYAWSRSASRTYVLWAFGLATLVSGAITWQDAVTQQSHWLGASGLQHLGLRPHNNITLPLSQDSPNFKQTFRVNSPLEGLDVAIAVSPDGQASPYDLRVSDLNGNILRSVEAPTSGLHNGQWLRFDFPPVTPPTNGILAFSLEPRNRPVDNPLSVQIRDESSYPHGTLEAGNKRLAHVVVFEPRIRVTLEDIPFTRKLRHHAQVQVPTVLLGLCLIFVALLRKLGLRSVAVASGLLLVYMALLRMPYYGIDEGSHVAIADYWRLHHRLPRVMDNCDTVAMQAMNRSLGAVENVAFVDEGRPMHEAVQPPLYYLLLAAVGSITSLIPQTNDAFIFYTERVFGALLVAFGGFFLAECYQTLVRRRQIPRQDGLFLSIFVSVICSSGYLLNFSAITNDQLCFFLVNLSLWLVCSCKWRRPLAWRTVWHSALLCAAMWMTKLTSLGACAVLASLVAIYGANRQRLAFAAVVTLFVGPWYVANFLIYGAPTGMAEHIAIVLPVLNSWGRKELYGRLLTFSLPAYLFNFFLSSYDKLWGMYLSQMKAWLLMAGLGSSLLRMVETAVFYLKQGKIRNAVAVAATPSAVSLGLFSSIILMALKASHSANIDFFAPRYGYMYAGPVCMFLAIAIDNVRRRVDKVLLLSLLTLGTLWLSGLVIHRLPVWVEYHF
ncbi:MAG: hypothetical protein EOO38_00705 [Cytophagaceae bacterium]|nr:MAG: hypothetical protein EOO38_00705 [Cytophagaceae bacterium]